MSNGTQLHTQLRFDQARMARESPLFVERSLAIVCRNLVRESNALLYLGRYQLVRTLGRGGSGVVYEAFEPLRAEHLALKILYERGPSYLYRLKREFRSLAELRHPNLVALHELSVGSDDAYFTMDLHRGCDLISYIQHQALHAPDSRARTRDALAQLCEGVHALHCAGKLHRDLKPSNILVTDAGHVVLVDFGLADDAHTQTAYAAGTPGYMAPEQARGAASESSDWYSVGCVMREALSVLQARSANTGTGDRDHQGLRALTNLCARLVDLDAARRPGFAEIIAVVRGTSEPTLRHADATNVVAQPSSLIARENELRQLGVALARSRTQPVMLLVRGESGIGKSALLRHFADSLVNAGDQHEALVLHGRCYERESVPFKALDSLIDELSRILLSLPREHAECVHRLDNAALLAVFPVLGRVPWLRAEQATVADVDPVELHTRGCAALRAVLTQLASKRALVLCIDDLQWSDAESGRLLGALLCEEDSPCALVIATDRSDAHAINPAIEQLQHIAELSPRPLCVEELELGPLNPAASAALAQARLTGVSSTNSAEIEQICAEARGNPRVLDELSRWVADRTHGTIPELVPPSIDILLDRRLNALAAASWSVLQLVAAAGRPLPAAVIASAAELSLACHVQVRELRAAGVLRASLRNGDEWLELDHDRIGEVVLRYIDDAARIQLHVQLARALEEAPGVDGEVLVDQYLGARMPLAAARQARRVADSALAALAFARAARLYEQALALGDWNDSERAELHTQHGVALERAGHKLEAAAAFLRAAALTSDPMALHLEQRAATHLVRNGRYREGEALFERGYRALGLRWPRSRFGLACSIAWHALPTWLRHPWKASRISQELLRERVAFLVPVSGGVQNYDLLRTIDNCLRLADTGSQLDDPLMRIRCTAIYSLLRSLGFWPGGVARGIAELEHALSAVAVCADAEASGGLEHCIGLSHYFNGQPREALAMERRAEAHLRECPHLNDDVKLVTSTIASALFDLGRVREARRCWNGLTHGMRMQSDLMTTAWVHAQPMQLAVLFASDERARIDAILDRVAQLRTAHPRYPLIAWVHALGSVERALYCGSAQDALQIAQRERRILFGLHPSVLGARARILRARACLNAAADLAAGRARSALLRRAALDVRCLKRHTSEFFRGIACLLEAASAHLQERRQRAITELDTALQLFGASDAALLGTAARYCKGALLGGDEGRTLIELALAELHAQDIVDVPRFIAWLACGFRGTVHKADERARF